jgi:hypothetical protein
LENEQKCKGNSGFPGFMASFSPKHNKSIQSSFAWSLAFGEFRIDVVANLDLDLRKLCKNVPSCGRIHHKILDFSCFSKTMQNNPGFVGFIDQDSIYL